MKIATGRVIKAFRKHLGYTQEYLAKQIYATTRTVENIERGKVGMDLEKLYIMSKLFKIPLRTLIQVIIEIFEKGSDEGLESTVVTLRPLQTEKDLLDD
jgi:transcriptional regulator with XRE-family HTH domain